MQVRAVYDNFIDKYAEQAPMVEHAFLTDAEEVNTYIGRFTSGNTVAEAKTVAHAAEINGRLDLTAIKDHYEGVGVNAVNAVQADKVLNDLFF